MRLVAIDTATEVGSIAVFEGASLVASASQRVSNAHGEALLPALDALLGKLGVGPGGVDLWAVDVGPGSFTGVRVGVALVRGVTMATGARAVGASSLEILLEDTAHADALAALPSLPGEVYVQARRGGSVGEPAVVRVEALAAQLGGFAPKVVVGAAAAAVASALSLPPEVVAASVGAPRADALGRLALAGRGRPSLEPLYLKPPPIHGGSKRV